MFVRSLIAGLAFAGWAATAQATALNAGFEGAFEFTGFISVVLPVGMAMFTFTVFDVGDWIIDSPALNDTNNAMAQIPKPGTLSLFGLGLAGLGWNRRRSGG